MSNNALPAPASNLEKYLTAILTGDTDGLPTPASRLDQILCALAKSGLGTGAGPVKYVESPDADGNAIHLRDLESGTYILHGTFIAWWDGADTRRVVSFSYGFPSVIGRTESKTYLTCIYPPQNTLQYLEITDEGVFRKDAKLLDMMPGLIGKITVTEDEATITCDKTCAEVLEALASGTPVIFVTRRLADNSQMLMTSIQPGDAGNVLIQDFVGDVGAFSLNADNTVTRPE